MMYRFSDKIFVEHADYQELKSEMAELISHINSLPPGHYSAWLTQWAKENARR